MNKRDILKLISIGMAPLPSGVLAQGGDYPNRALRLISPFSAGSTSDGFSRYVGQNLSVSLRQPVAVENIPGADGRLGIMAAKNAPPDGYTLCMGTWSNLAVNSILVKDLPYDPLKDFKPVAGVARSALGIVVPGASSVQTLGDLLAMAKARPARVNFGTFANGYRLAIEWIAGLANVQFTQVPYRTTSQMVADLAGRQIDAGMDGLTSLAALVKSGHLRLIATTGEERHPDYPNVPSVAETFKDYYIYGWSALIVRTEVPDDITAKLSDATLEILRSRDGREFVRRAGADPVQLNRIEMRKYQVEQIQILRKVANAAGLKPE